MVLEHLVTVVIPLSRNRDIPSEAPTTMPKLPTLQKVGTISDLAKEKEQQTEETMERLKADAMLELEAREERGETDRLEYKQHLLPPKPNKLKGFPVEMAFEYPGEDGSQCLGWYNGIVDKVLNAKVHKVRIKWDDDCIGEDDAEESNVKLIPGNWNPRRAKKGGWRKCITK